MKHIKHHRFTRFTFLAGFIWGIIGLISCLQGYRVDENELIPAFVPAFILMFPTLYYFFINSTSVEVMPGFLGLYFKRRRLQEEAKIAEIIPDEKISAVSTETIQAVSFNEAAETEKEHEIKEEEKGFSRLPYILLIAVVAFASSMLPHISPLNEVNVWLFIIPLVGITYAIVFYRLQNIGYRNPALLTLLSYVPPVNLYFAFVCLTFPKDYALTKKMDPTGRLLGLLFILFLVFVIIAITVPAI